MHYAIGKTLPVLLLIGSVAAPLGVAELVFSGTVHPSLAVAPAGSADVVSFAARTDEALVLPAARPGCEGLPANGKALGTAPSPAVSYDVPVAEGAAPPAPNGALAMPAFEDGAMVVGEHFRVSVDGVAAVLPSANDCQDQPISAAAPLEL